MKKLVIVISDEGLQALDMGAIFRAAADVRMETLENGERARHTRVVKPGTSVGDVIMSHFTAEGVFTTDLAGQWVAKVGYSPHSASPAAAALVNDGYLERIDRGRFKFVRREMT